MPPTPLSSQEEEKQVGRMDAQLAKRLLKYAWPYKKLLLLTLFLVLMVPLLDLAGTIIVKEALDGPLKSIIDSGSSDGSSSISGMNFFQDWAQTFEFELDHLSSARSSLFNYCRVYLFILLMFIALRYAQGLMMATIGQKVMRDVRMQIFSHLQRMPLEFFHKNPVGALVTRLTNDVEALNQLFTSGVVTLLADIILLTGISCVLFYNSPDLALVTVSVVPVLLIATFIFRYFARKFYREQRSHLSHLNAFTQESLQGIDTIQLFTRESETRSRFRGINFNYMKAFLKTVLAYSIYFPVIEMVSATALVLIILRGGYLLGSNGIEFGTFFLFWRFLERFLMPIRDMAERYNVLQAAMAASERIFRVLDSEESIRNRPDAKSVDNIKGEIEFDRVTFSYNSKDIVLKNFSAKVKTGESVAIVGATGAGKSTLITLLSRFYDPQEGGIKLDGTDLRDLKKQEFRSRMAVVLQDPFIFSRSILENITLGNPNISREQAIEAAKRVNAHGFIERLPDGYDTHLQERGGTLSVGERQLLSFARALSHDPDLIVLDEATAHVDTETEKLIQEALEVLLKDRTSIVIAHRLSTIQRADRILVLHKGELRESGQHQELLTEKGIYYRLYQLQFLGEAGM